MAIALQASHTHTHTHIACMSMATSNILNHASKSFQKLLSAASPTNSICQAWRVRSLSVWLIHLQFQSKQTNNLTTYICTYVYVHKDMYTDTCIYSYVVVENVTKTFAEAGGDITTLLIY